MNTTKNLLLAGLLAAVGGSVAHAQFSYSNSLAGATLIYSNSFTGGAVNITNTPPDYAVSRFGGTNTALWLCAGGLGETNALYANGTVTSILGDSWLLPFKAQSNYVYTLTATVNFTGNPGNWVVAGFAQNYASPGVANSAPNGSGVNGYAWTLRNYGGNTEFFAGAAGGNNVYNATPAGAVGAGTYGYTQILDTTGSKWVINAFFNGVQLGAPYTYASNPNIGAIMIGQHSLANPAAYTYTSLALSATPIVIGQQPVSASVGGGSAFTNTVLVAANKPSYQWYNNGVPISGATNASLVFNPVVSGNAGTNYYVVITNSLGSATSAVWSLNVASKPAFAKLYPTGYTNPITLFGGSTVGGTNYAGSSPMFSVSAVGDQPITYQWLTNGVAVGGATNTTFRLANCQLSGPTSVACIAANSFGAATNTWSLAYVPSPTAPYPQTLLGYQPLDYWRLNEGPDDGAGDNGVLALDYGSGNNGIYTNAYLGAIDYSLTEPDTTSAYFSATTPSDSDAFNIQGVDFSAPAGSNAVFSISAWAFGSGVQASGAGILAKGYGGAEQFVLDVFGGKYRFALRDAAGNLYSATAGVGPSGAWDYLVGVCDEVHSNVTLYVNGVPMASVAIAPGSGLLASSVPMTIGARSSSATAGHNDLQFKGYVGDAATFKSALSVAQEVALYTAAGYAVQLYFVPPPSSVVYQANKTLTIPTWGFGATNLGYYWTDQTTGVVLGSGAISTYQILDATLTISNAPNSLSGDQLQLVITNDTSFNAWNVTLYSPPPPVTLDYSDPILYSNYFNGGTWPLVGTPATAANALVGGTNTTWVNALGTNALGGSLQASGVDGSTNLDSWELPFTPRAGYVYTLTASLTFSGNPGNWVGLGFAQRIPTNAALGYGRFADGGTTPPQQGPNGYDWLILTEANGTIQYFTGPAGTPAGGITNGTFFSAGAGTHTVTIVLDTTGAQWKYSAAVDGTSTQTYTYSSNPPIGAIGITQTGVTAPTLVQWNYLALTQVAPGGVPPYLFAPLPPSSVTLLAGTSLSIPASAFGSVPLGYYWSNTNTAAVLGSGTTDNVAPLNANLSLASVPIGWNGNTLALVVTNAYGTNISLVALTVTNAVNPSPVPVQVAVAGSQLTLSWPTDHIGWALQVQTNGLGTNWVDLPGSSVTNQIILPVDPLNRSVFYRMILRP